MRRGARAQKDPDADSSATRKGHFIIITKGDPGKPEEQNEELKNLGKQ